MNALKLELEKHQSNFDRIAAKFSDFEFNKEMIQVLMSGEEEDLSPFGIGQRKPFADLFQKQVSNARVEKNGLENAFLLV
jgi:hypothetical protein